MTKQTILTHVEWAAVVQALRRHLEAADNAWAAKEVSRELRAWLDLEPGKAAVKPTAPAER